jgi:hypothetical protein
MADGVDADVHAEQVAGRDLSIDASAMPARVEELSARHHAVLTRRQCADAERSSHIEE